MNALNFIHTNMSGRSRPYDQTSLASQPSRNSCTRNAFSLLAQREISPRTKHIPRRNWVDTSTRKSATSTRPRSKGPKDARHGLLSWVESESVRHLSAKYCPLFPPPRSTIAAAFSPDGNVLASTHGDHTVKIIDCQTGNCLKVLVGHRRTPWVVRFHPLHPEILASGSLDQEVRLWDAKMSECIISHQFYRPIASIAFHAKGEILAVASGHKLYIWHYNKRGEASSPTFVLKTRRSLRAVHFHPLAAPFLLTAEVNDLDSSDSSMTQATTLGYLQYPPPAVFVANVKASEYSVSNDAAMTSFPFFVMPPYSIDDLRIEQPSSSNNGSSSMQAESSTSIQFQRDTNAIEQYGGSMSAIEAHPIPTDLQFCLEFTTNTSLSNVLDISMGNVSVDNMETDEMQPAEGSLHQNSANIDIPGVHISNPDNSAEFGHFSRLLPSRDKIGWELPFLQGWLIGQTQAGARSMLPNLTANRDNLTRPVNSSMAAPNNLYHNAEAIMESSAVPSSIGIPGGSGRQGMQSYLQHSRVSAFEPGNLAASSSISQDGSDIQTIVSRVQPELAASVAAAAAAELPCTVKLRVWKFEIRNPCAQLVADKCRLTIPHAVLCSEMGAHFSPCGRFLAACVACMYPHVEHDPGLQSSIYHDSGAATSPTRHPLSAHQVMYELRIYSLEEATFGAVLASRAIRAAHCLTSIQFSPTSEHILLAYGRRHGSLLKSIVIDGETTLPIYTVLEVYKVSDMELVRVLPSAEDEVNVACFHPFAGGGLVYGTKEGKLRVLQCDRGLVNCGPNHFPEENFLV